MGKKNWYRSRVQSIKQQQEEQDFYMLRKKIKSFSKQKILSLFRFVLDIPSERGLLIVEEGSGLSSGSMVAVPLLKHHFSN